MLVVLRWRMCCSWKYPLFNLFGYTIPVPSKLTIQGCEVIKNSNLISGMDGNYGNMESRV